MFLETLVTSGVVCFKIFHLRISEPLGLCAGNQKDGSDVDAMILSRFFLIVDYNILLCVF